ncbi:CLUMA_CG012965, isoform A [Clunio marinus]|uniref:CLUMA_CG012965, isoform A n=1 Tax=Clunio marinus TaxID=568069 RepID=A0A1J1IHE4_9DIPT|nr:CLUMA_CG012965, isoform A [Clunio marinus]
MDPFDKIPEDIHDEVLKYFKAEDMIEVLSLVSKAWYSAVASSNICMRKIKLNLRSKRKNDFTERIETLNWMSRKDGRSFQHLQINCLLDEGISQEVWSFLHSRAESIETINIRSMKFESDFIVTNIKLPKLEELKMMFVPRDAMNCLMTSTSSLKTMILRNEFPLCYDGVDYTPSETTIKSVQYCISANTKLEDLEIQGRPNFFGFFHKDLSEYVSFNLSKLVLKVEMSVEKISTECESNIIKFMKRQANSLEHFYIDSCGTNIIQFAFNSMPVLNFLRFDIELREPNKFNIKELNIEPNEKIKYLELPYIVLFDEVKDFLDLVPNVEEILIGHINPRVIEYTANNLQKLKSIVYRYDDSAGGCDKVYADMKIQNHEMNQNITLSLYNDFL